MHTCIYSEFYFYLLTIEDTRCARSVRVVCSVCECDLTIDRMNKTEFVYNNRIKYVLVADKLHIYPVPGAKKHTVTIWSSTILNKLI